MPQNGLDLMNRIKDQDVWNVAHMEVVDLGFSRLEFHPGYVITRTREGADIDGIHHRQIFNEADQQLDGVYAMVLDEVHRYSFRLGALVEMRMNPRLLCIAVVAYRPSTALVAKLTADSINKPVMLFDSLSSACAWVSSVLNS